LPSATSTNYRWRGQSNARGRGNPERAIQKRHLPETYGLSGGLLVSGAIGVSSFFNEKRTDTNNPRFARGVRQWCTSRSHRSMALKNLRPLSVSLRTRFIGAGAFVCARWGARGAECLPRDVRRRSSQATSRFDVITAHRCLCVRIGSAAGKHAPTPERCPRQEPLGRNRPSAFTLCYKVSGPSALPRALSQWTRGKGMKMIENGQNKAGFSGVCRCQITTYDRESEVVRGP